MTTRNKVKVGFFSFTEVTDPNEHRSYNEWHQLDHMPEQFPLRGIAYGQRWVSTPACRAARAVSGARLDPIHYVTLYLMTEPVDETLREFFALGKELHEKDRFHHHRKAHLSGPFPLVATAVAPRVLISAEAVPYRPHRGIYVAVQGATSDAASIEAAVTISGVAGAWAFADDERRITVLWCDEDVLDVAARVGPIEGAEFAGPFETVTPWQWDWFDQ
ncbi:MAG TPA: hypothetical protein VL856_06750 [Acidimicrobiia bacterium]|jgi:hypothetical protein|nr:hypothetical protein [Acidimicrobiia bacterium]